MKLFRYYFLFFFIILSLEHYGQGSTRLYIVKSEIFIAGCKAGSETGNLELFVDGVSKFVITYTTSNDDREWLRTVENRYEDIHSHFFNMHLKGWLSGCSRDKQSGIESVDAKTNVVPLVKSDVKSFGCWGGGLLARGYYLHYQTCFFPDRPQLKITPSSGIVLPESSIKVMPSEKLTFSATTADMNSIPVGSNNLRYEYYYSEYGTWEEVNSEWTRWKSNYDNARREMEYCVSSYNQNYNYDYPYNFQCGGGEFYTTVYGKIESESQIDMLTWQFTRAVYGAEPEQYITRTGYKPWRMMSGNVFDCSTFSGNRVKFKVRLQGSDEFIDSNDSPEFFIEKPVLNVNKTTICLNDNITLSVDTRYSAIPNPVTYKYQYKIANGSWKVLTDSPSSTYTFPLNSLPDLKNHIGLVYFRVQVANEESAFISTDLKHRPPVQRDILLQHSCPEMNEGYVVIDLPDTLNKGDVTVRYRIDNSADKNNANKLPDDAFGDGWTDLPTTSLGPFKLDVGKKYQFLLAYLDSKKSFCEHVIDRVEVYPLTTIMIGTPITRRVECFNHATGSATISINKDTGHQKLRYTLKKFGGDGLPFNAIEKTVTIPENSTSFTFDNLPHGSYQCSIQYLTVNPCDYSTATFDIVQPDPLSFTGNTLTHVTCSTINDGSIKVFTTGGSDTIRYQLFKLENGTPSELRNYTVYKNLAPIGLWLKRSDEFLTDSLPAGRYVVKIEDKCSTNVITDTFTVNPVVPLHISRDSWEKDSLRCWLDTTGYITVTASGGIDRYQWQLQSITPDSLLYHYPNPEYRESSSTQADFQNLPANVYQIRLGNQPRTLPTNFICPDFTVDTIEITQHRKINISNHLQHIGCKDEFTGKIDLQIVGGVPDPNGTYTYRWVLEGDVVGDSITIRNLRAGVYSVTVKDALYCPMLDTFELKEPPVKMNKTIAAVTRDIVCYGDSAIISQQPKFGWGQYNYQWESLDNNTIDGIHRELYVKDSMIYPTEPGRYRYLVIDSAFNNSNICVSDADTFTVTLPSAPLYMQANKQTWPNGLDVTCRGVKDGFILFDFGGGNSTLFDKLSNVYQYQRYILKSQWLDGDELMLDTFTQAKHFTSIDFIPFIHYRKPNYQGGRWKLWVEDHRGCKTKDTIINLLTPETEIHFNLHQLVHNECYGDSVGKITFVPSGGESPYGIQYKKYEDLEFLNIFTFDSLRSEKHSFKIRDNVGCITDTVIEIKNLHRPITLTENIFDVRCYDGSDGQYHFSADGDFPFVQYLWDNVAVPDTAIKELTAGTYKLHLRDSKNCQLTHTVNIGQPEKLLLSTFSKPVCSNQPLGYITARVNGGIKPYSYKFTDTSEEQSDSLLYRISGTYQVEVTDAHRCQVISEPTTINVNTIQPTPAFMVSTFNLLGDTVMLVEVSQPIPDSVHWDIDSSVESYLVGEIPHVILLEEGNANVRMKVFYGGCDFMLEKNIQAYSNDSLVVDWRKGTVETVDPITTFTVSPNPSQGTFRIESTLSEELPSSVKVYDMQGLMVMEKNFAPQTNVSEHITLSAPKTQNYYLFYFTEGGHRSALIHVTP